MWYFRPEEWKSAGRGGWEMEKIRANYGSVEVNAKPAQARPRLADD
jgi:hypothetical protein